jgi:phosphatidylinositol glycan class B
MKLVLIINTVMILIVIMRPADAQISLYHKLYKSYKEPTILYYIGKNPYHRVLDIYFYKRGNLSVVPITSVDNIPRGTNKLLVLEHKDESNNPRFGKLIFKTYPDWIMKFNFNNWQSRSNSWYIYEIK